MNLGHLRMSKSGAERRPFWRSIVAVATLTAFTSMSAATLDIIPSTAVATGGDHAAQWQQFSSGLKGKYAGKKIRLIMINDPFLPAFNKMADAFSALSGAKVSVDTFGYDATYQKEVLACGQNDKTYDIIVFDVPWTQKFVPCTDSLNAYVKKTDATLLQYDDFFPVMREASQWNNEIVGFPFAPYFVLQSYNAKYYKALGLQPAKTLDQFVSNAATATKNEKLPAVYGTSMNNQSGSAVGQAFFEYIYNFPGGKPFTSEYPGSAKPYANMTPLFASKQGIAVVDLFKKLIASQPPGALNSAWQSRQTAFATGHVAAVNEWDVTTPSLSDPTQSTVVNDFATADFPSNGKLVTQVGGWTMGINKYGTQKDIAWDFIKWFTSPETALAFSKAGGFPQRTSLLANADLNKQYPWYASLKTSVPTAFADCRPRVSQSFDIINTLGTYIGKALAGSMSSKDAMLGADREIGTMLKKAGYRVDSLTD
jgi:multiple sugar transport system substrate-binding protein